MTPYYDKPAENFIEWYESLPVLRQNSGPAKGTICGALVVLERLREQCDLRIASHLTKGGTQISGLSGGTVKKILADFGETRPFASEAGRTNRGLRQAMESMLGQLRAGGLCDLDTSTRLESIQTMQSYLVEQVIGYHNRQRLAVAYDPTKSSRNLITDIMALARQTNREGPVAQYLVGAKLQLRFPEIEIENESYSTADQQLSRPGDFLVGNTVFHVTVAPMDSLIEKCRTNLAQGYRVYILTPSGKPLEMANGVAGMVDPERVTTHSIEGFIAQNIDELSGFDGHKMNSELKHLLTIYNTRIEQVETDKSMMVEIPINLR